MLVNGKEKQLAAEMTLLAYLEQEQYTLNQIAVERNGEIVPKAAYAQTILKPSDVLEVVSFMGGG